MYRLIYCALCTGWEVAAQNKIQGVTHQSRANNFSSNNFSHNFTLDISKSTNTDDPPPLILLEVFKVGLLHRQKVVGYGFLNFPQIPGLQLFTVPTWYPCIEEPTQQLLNHFLNIRPQISDLTYAGRPNKVKHNYLY